MPTPKDLALTVEQYDQEQWFEFLDELDLVSRRRRQRDSAEPAPDVSDRDEVALWVAKKHLIVDSGTSQVLYFPKGAAADEIRLLEVNDRLPLPEVERGEVKPMASWLNVEGALFRLLIADLTNEQLDDIKAARLALPPGWDLDGHITTSRSSDREG